MFFRKKPVPTPMVPEPGQQVHLLGLGIPGRREVRAISEPYTNARGEVVVRVTEEWEYQDALREGRRPIGIPWPVKHIVIVPPSGPLDAPETASAGTEGVEKTPADVGGAPTAPQCRPWWRRWFGLE